VADVRIRWNLDVVDRGAGAKILRQDRAIRRGLESTDRQYRKTATSAASASQRQAAASARAERGVRSEGRAATATSSDFRRLNSAQREALVIGQRLISQADRVGAAYRRQSREVEQASRRQRVAARSRGAGVGGLGVAGAVGGGIRGGIGAAVGIGGTVAATAGIAKAISLGNEYNRTIDAQRVGFTSLLHSQKQAADLMAKMQALAIKSPVLDVQTTGNAARTLLAYGIALKDVLPLTKAIGDMSAASGKSIEEALPNAALAIGQVASKGKLQAQEMNQLAQSVGLSRGRIRKALGLTAKEFEETFKPGQNVSAARALPAILKAMQDQSAGAADRLAKTTQGKLSRTREVIAKAMGQMTRPLYDAVGDLGGHLADAMQKVDFTKVGDTVARKMKQAVSLGIKGAGIAAVVGRGVAAGLRGDDAAGKPAGPSRVEGMGAARVQPVSPAEKIGTRIGQIARTVEKSVSKIVGAGHDFVDALKPAAPLLDALKPAAEGAGGALAGSFVLALKAAAPPAHVLAIALGGIGKFLDKHPALARAAGAGLLILAARTTTVATATGKFGTAIRLLTAPIRLATSLVTKLGGAAARALIFRDGQFVGPMRRLGPKIRSALSPLKGLMTRLMGGAGTSAGAAAADGVGSKIGSDVGPSLSKRRGRIGGSFRGAGKLAGLAFGAAAAISIGLALTDALQPQIHAIAQKIADLVTGVDGARLKAENAKKFASNAAWDPLTGGIDPKTGKYRPPTTKPLVIPGPSPKHKRSGGIVGYAAGGIVDAMVSPGEQLIYGGRSTIVPGPPVAADSVHVRVPAGTAVLTGDGQARMSAGASLGAALMSQAPHFRAGGVVAGRYVSTAYGPPWGGIQGTGTTATGVNLHSNPHVYGIAVDPSMIRLGAQVYAKPNPFGRSGPFRAFDTGGAIKGRRIDFYDWRGRKSQNAWGRRSVSVSASSLGGGTGGAVGSGADLTAHVPIVYGRSRTRAGLVPDALQQGIDAGTAGLTRSEISRAVRGARGAERNPMIQAIVDAYSATTREVKIPGAGTSGAGGKMPTGVTVPGGTFNPLRKPIARWIVPYLTWAASHGWRGTVTSGWRSASQQMAAAKSFGLGKYGKGGPLGSNHMRSSFPGGAVDVTQAAQLSGVLGKRPGPHLLRWAGAKDPVHFSHPHGGSYRRGGIVGAGRTLNAAVGAARTLKAGTLDTLDAAIGVAAESRLDALRVGILRLVRAGGPKRTIQRLQGVLDLIDFEVGRRIGAINAAIERRSTSIDRTSGAVDRAMRRAGVDADTVGGLARTGLAIGYQEVPARQANVRSAQSALKRARGTGNREAIKAASDQLAQAQDDLDEALTKQIETGRQLVVRLAQDTVDKTTKVSNDAREALDRTLRKAGIDAGSSAGLIAENAQDAIDVRLRLDTVGEISKQLAHTKDPGARSQITDLLDQARKDLDEALAVQIERRRELIRATAQERVDTAQFGVDVAQGALSGLDVAQRLNRTTDTPGGMVARAQAIQSTLLPALTATKTALDQQVTDLTSIGDVAGARGAFTAAQQAANDLSGAMADAADLIRQAAEQTAQDLVDSAAHGSTMADLGLQRIELEQRIAGTFDAGGQARADYIKATVIPAIQAEIDALTAQQATATAEGDPVLARQIAEQIAGKQNDQLQAIIDATEETATNTADRRVGGTVGFTYGNENVTDALIDVGNGS
jgi:tape measure domain-containing protein